MAKLPTPQMLVSSRPAFPDQGWLDTKPEFTPGSFCYPAKQETMELLHMPNPHEWDPSAEDWNLPENWEQILCDAFADRLEKHRSLKLFMDICVRCGACADKCHFFLGTNDPKNMPVLRAELLRSLYRRDHTMLGKILGMDRLAGAKLMDFYNSLADWGAVSVGKARVWGEPGREVIKDKVFAVKDLTEFLDNMESML